MKKPRIDMNQWVPPCLLAAFTVAVLVVLVIPVAGPAPTSWACGPEFDDAYLVRGSREQFLSLPEGSFLYELERITGPSSHKEPAPDTDLSQRTADADLSDLKAALAASGLSGGQRRRALASYTEARSQLLQYLEDHRFETSQVWYGGSFRHHERGVSRPVFAFPRGFTFAPEIPEEFVRYLKGAVAYHNDEFEIAITIWKEVLQLPEAERRYRTVWAAFMLGKAFLSLNKQAEALPYFQMSREYAAQGFSDSLGLADASYGWQALAEYESGAYAASLRHYLNVLDVASLKRVCRTVFNLDEKEFDAVVQDELARQVLIGWAVSRTPWTYWYRTIEGDPAQNLYAKLLRAIECLDSGGSVARADRLAWICYNHGDFAAAHRWLTLSEESSPLAQWIRSKLLLREGNIEEALKVLGGLIALFEQAQAWDMFYQQDRREVSRTIDSEKGLLQLRRQDYLTAFHTLIAGGAYWEDIAYVAEKVLTAAELEEYLKADTADSAASAGLERTIRWYYPSHLAHPTVAQALRYLLARRFARQGSWDNAREYMPTAFTRQWGQIHRDPEGYPVYEPQSDTFSPRAVLQQLRKFVEAGQDTSRSLEARAQNYYEAGRLMRAYGMELTGTELDPDWFVFNGQYAYDNSLEHRFALLTTARENFYRKYYESQYRDIIEKVRKRRREIEQHRGFFTGSKNEEDRAVASLPDPAARFHYRYRAADLMWRCAELLPDNHELKARALCVGGTYLKYRDPDAANTFYQALVRTCPETTPGTEAAALRWFPKTGACQ